MTGVKSGPVCQHDVTTLGIWALTIRRHEVVVVFREDNVPNLPPLHLGRRPAGPLAAQQLGGRRPVDARLRVVIRNVTHLLTRQPLVVMQLTASRKVAVAAAAHKGRGVVALVLLDNVLAQLGKLGEEGHGARVVVAHVEPPGIPLAERAA